MNDFILQHQQWVNSHLALIYCAVSGALMRLLLMRNELFLIRLQNAIAGVILALVLAPMTADYLTNGKYTLGYAMFFGVVARELVVSFIDAINDTALPFFYSIFDTLIPGNKNKHNKEADK